MMTGIPGCGVVKVLPMDFNVRFICTRNAREPLHETPLRRARGTHRGRRRAMLANPSTAKQAGSLDPNRVRTGLTLTLSKCTSQSGVSERWLRFHIPPLRVSRPGSPQRMDLTQFHIQKILKIISR